MFHRIADVKKLIDDKSAAITVLGQVRLQGDDR